MDNLKNLLDNRNTSFKKLMGCLTILGTEVLRMTLIYWTGWDYFYFTIQL